MNPPRARRMVVALLVLVAVALSGCGQSLKIRPPKPTKLAKKGQGATPQIVYREGTSLGGDERDFDPAAPGPREDDVARRMRDFDDDIAAWHRAYATNSPQMYLIEKGLTERADAQADELLELARGDHIPFAMVAATAIAFANRTETVTPLVDLVNSERDIRVRRNAVNGLGILASRNPQARARIPQQLARELLASSEPSLRISGSFLAKNLVTRGDDRGLLPYLAEGRQDSEYMVRANCVWAVGRTAQPGATEILEIALAGDPMVEVRCNAALALAATSDARAVDVLIANLDGQAPEVTRHCVGALGLLTGEKHGEDAAAWRAWWAANREGFQPRVLDRPPPDLGGSAGAAAESRDDDARAPTGKRAVPR